MQNILSTDTELMLFAYRFLRQTMFGEESILNEDRRTRQTLGAQT